MAFTDPQSITISGNATSLPRTATEKNSSEYTSADGLMRLTASHSYGNRNRHVLRFDHAKIAADPLAPALNARYSMSNYMVFDVPVLGYTAAEIKAIYVGFNSLYTASTHAAIDKVLAGES